jgi:hypothetical protein
VLVEKRVAAILIKLGPVEILASPLFEHVEVVAIEKDPLLYQSSRWLHQNSENGHETRVLRRCVVVVYLHGHPVPAILVVPNFQWSLTLG